MARLMAHDHSDAAYLPGPLDELVPGLRRKADKLPPLPVHPRVVRPRSPDGSSSIVMLSFAAAHNVRTLHAALRPMVEAAMLSELCAPAADLAELYSPISELTLLMFEQQGFDPTHALSPFGFQRSEPNAADLAQILALARREAHTLSEPMRDEPVAVYRARVVRSPNPLAARLHEALIEHAPKGPWGREPGLLARTVADWLATQGVDDVRPTRAGVERLESIVVHHERGVVRFIEPLVFQGLCDLIAVLGAARPGLGVEWGVCDLDPDTKLAPPPVLRVTRDEETFHVPLGEHVLRWCVMPIGPSESVPTLGAWAEHEFV